jgi:hypothetical protein
MKYLITLGYIFLSILIGSSATFAQKSQTDFNSLKTFGTMGKQQSVLNPNMEADYTPVAGLTHFDSSKLEFSAYRFHDEDTVFFKKDFA